MIPLYARSGEPIGGLNAAELRSDLPNDVIGDDSAEYGACRCVHMLVHMCEHVRVVCVDAHICMRMHVRVHVVLDLSRIDVFLQE